MFPDHQIVCIFPWLLFTVRAALSGCLVELMNGWVTAKQRFQSMLQFAVTRSFIFAVLIQMGWQFGSGS